MIDRTIPFYNIILRCDSYRRKNAALAEGYSIVPYRRGYEKDWARLEYSLGDFDSVEEAESCFISTYLRGRGPLGNILFLVNEDNAVAGSCIAWQDRRGDSLVSSLHWLVVDEKYRGMGLGRALCCAAMDIFEEQGNFPIYIHTQPWSLKAIFLYLSLGFKLQKSDTFSHYVNEYHSAMTELMRIVSEKQFELLLELS
jgi:ribosomal protein S18 acetylase RimI-like enzyme